MAREVNAAAAVRSDDFRGIQRQIGEQLIARNASSLSGRRVRQELRAARTDEQLALRLRSWYEHTEAFATPASIISSAATLDDRITLSSRSDS